jgi:hypothetical protein
MGWERRFCLGLEMKQPGLPRCPAGARVRCSCRDQQQGSTPRHTRRSGRAQSAPRTSQPILHPLRDRSDGGGQRTSRYLTTLIAPRGRAILASDLWITGRTLTPVPDQEKPPGTTGAVGVDPSRTTSYVARRSVVSSAGCAACPRQPNAHPATPPAATGPHRWSSSAAPPRHAFRVADRGVAFTERSSAATARPSSRRSLSARYLRSTAWASIADRRAACLTDC